MIRQIRSCENLNDVAKSIIAKNNTQAEEVEEYDSPFSDDNIQAGTPQFETELSGKMGELRLENGSLSFIGGTSNLLFLRSISDGEDVTTSTDVVEQHYSSKDDAIVSWTRVTPDPKLVGHLINMYFTWHYTYFTTLSKSLFNHDFLLGKPVQANSQKTTYCSSLLVNAMLALGCHFSAWPASKAESTNSATAGDHFFKEAKRLIMENGEWENPSLTTVQALALMSVREAGCGREAKGWVYSGMSFRMACDLGLNVDPGSSNRSDHEIDARRITIWGCFLFDKLVRLEHVTKPPALISYLGAGRIIWDVSLSYRSQALQCPNLTFFRGKMPITGLRTRIMALCQDILSPRAPVPLLCRYLHFVRSAGTCFCISIIPPTWRNRWVDRKL